MATTVISEAVLRAEPIHRGTVVPVGIRAGVRPGIRGKRRDGVVHGILQAPKNSLDMYAGLGIGSASDRSMQMEARRP